MAKPRPAHTVSVSVRVRPGASRTHVGGRYDGPHGPALRLRPGEGDVVEGEFDMAAGQRVHRAQDLGREELAFGAPVQELHP